MKNETFKYTVNYKLYAILLVVSSVIVASSFCFCGSRAFTIVSGLGCGGIASTLVAFLIEISTCRYNNQRLQESRKTLIRYIKESMRSIAIKARDIIIQNDDTVDKNETEPLYWLKKLADQYGLKYPVNIQDLNELKTTIEGLAEYSNAVTSQGVLLANGCLLNEREQDRLIALTCTAKTLSKYNLFENAHHNVPLDDRANKFVSNNIAVAIVQISRLMEESETFRDAFRLKEWKDA